MLDVVPHEAHQNHRSYMYMTSAEQLSIHFTMLGSYTKELKKLQTVKIEEWVLARHQISNLFNHGVW